MSNLNITNKKQFSSPQESHRHSLETLELLYEYDDFMMSIDTLCDIGCGKVGLDLEWWATRTTRDDDNPIPLDITCTGIDQYPSLEVESKYDNISYKGNQNFEKIQDDDKYDILWCHDAFQYAIDPIRTLKKFNEMLTPNGMLAMSVPQSTNVEFHKQEYNQFDGVYHNHTLVSLIHMLSVNGFDCKSGFFKKLPNDPWINLVVYKSDISPLNPRTTRWYDLVDMELLPDSADDSINRSGFLRQRDLVLPWLNKSNIDYSKT